ncbi:hypothetical protein [Streptomyces sp. NPDC058308]|uniref:hypothetical protein n=1 Tax=Streptomyces sp. NPDC058308 TaxID=3346440 RepID=UPI0036EC9EA6
MHISRFTGSCYLSLGDFRRAERLLTKTTDELHDRRNSRAVGPGSLALARIRRGEMDAALVAFSTAVNELHSTRGGGGMNVAFSAARELRPWRDELAVQEAQDQLMTLMEVT